MGKVNNFAGKVISFADKVINFAGKGHTFGGQAHKFRGQESGVIGPGLESRIQDSGFRVQDVEFRV